MLVVSISFAALLYFGSEIYQKAPPLPTQVANEDGTVLINGQDIKDGQNVWQSIGGQEIGSVWGHGAYTAPDWTADYIHREAIFMLDKWAQQAYHQPYDRLNKEIQAIEPSSFNAVMGGDYTKSHLNQHQKSDDPDVFFDRPHGRSNLLLHQRILYGGLRCFFFGPRMEECHDTYAD